MGGGFPAAAFGGRADVMAQLAPEGPVYQAGTLSGNPIATTAGLATLRLATDEVYAHIDQGRRRRPGGGRRGTRRRPACRTSSRPPAPCSRVFFADRSRCRDFDGRLAAGRSPRSRRSSTRCWTRASTCRRSAYEALVPVRGPRRPGAPTVLDALPARRRAAARRRDRGSER